MASAALLSLTALAAPTAPSTPPAASAAETYTDTEILAMLTAIHDSAVDQARSAAKRATDHHVKRLAHAVERRAEGGKRREERLSKRHNLQSAGGKAVDDLRQALKQHYNDLAGTANGPEFDRSYVNDEIAALNYVLTTIDNKLLPNVRLNELRGELGTVRDEISADLKKAHEVHDRLDKLKK